LIFVPILVLQALRFGIGDDIVDQESMTELAKKAIAECH